MFNKVRSAMKFVDKVSEICEDAKSIKERNATQLAGRHLKKKAGKKLLKVFK